MAELKAQQESMKEKLEKEKKKKNDAFMQAHNYCEELLDAHKEKDDVLTRVKNVDESVAAVEKRTKDILKPLIINYNTNVIEF